MKYNNNNSLNESKTGKRERNSLHNFVIKFLLLASLLFLMTPAVRTEAATAGFKKIGNGYYYINSDGTKQKGFVTLFKTKKYYFNYSNGRQKKGLVNTSEGLRYFGNKYGFNGYMRTGFIKLNSKYYFFDKSTGLAYKGWMHRNGKKYYFGSDYVMYTGLRKVGSYYYLFNNLGVVQKTGLTIYRGSQYYFDPATGRMKTGVVTTGGSTYYFGTNGKLVKNKTVVVSGVTYKVDSNGYASAVIDSASVATNGEYTYTINDGYITAYDKTQKKNYYIAREFATHPGVADGKLTDRDLLAAMADSEAGDQGLIGMEAVIMTLLNSTIDESKCYPSVIRLALYQQLLPNSTIYPGFSVVRDGALLKRLNGDWYDRTNAYKAADAALKIFNQYVLNGTPRYLKGFDRKDFNFVFFMTESAFWNQDLTFSKVDWFKYKDHVFFVDWV